MRLAIPVPFSLQVTPTTTQSAVSLALHLLHGLARAGHVRDAEPLGDDAVEARHFQALEPVRGLLRVAGRGRDVEGQRLHLRAPLLERLAVEVLAVPEEDVEADEARGDLGRELPHPALGRVEPHLERVEVERAVADDHDLPVHRRPRRKQLSERRQLGEVAEERARVPAPEVELALEVLPDPAEAVPLGLELPAVAFGELRPRAPPPSAGREVSVGGATSTAISRV